ncbi:hypothetical protein BJY52DRAFT_1390525 [Lactarius psammicola]|nr:hypothetical protein BJY52DRAFT_1390525 [Lactarius psammicola]
MAYKLGSIHEIDSLITQVQHVLSISSRFDPRRHLIVYLLAMLRLLRHMQSNQREDLDKAILHFTESLLVPCLWLEDGRDILTALFLLAFALLKRSKVSHQPEDVIYAAKYLRHFDTSLTHLELEAGNVTQDIDEMAVLCRELMDASDSDTIGPIALFVGLVTSTTTHLAIDPPSNQVIECLRLVRKYKPDLLEARLALAFSLANRYFMTFVNDDYEEAASIFDEIITSSSAGDDQGESVVLIQEFVTMLATLRSSVCKTPEYTEEAIYRARATPGQSSRIDRFAAMAAEQRFGYFGSIEGPEASTSILPLSQPVPVRPMKELKGNPEIGQWKVLDLLKGLLSGIHDGDITEIDEAIEKGRSAVASAPRNLFVEIWSRAHIGSRAYIYVSPDLSYLRVVVFTC